MNFKQVAIGFVMGVLAVTTFIAAEALYDKNPDKLTYLSRADLIEQYDDEIEDYFCSGMQTDSRDCTKQAADIFTLGIDHQYYVVVIFHGNTSNTVFGRRSFFRLPWVV